MWCQIFFPDLHSHPVDYTSLRTTPVLRFNLKAFSEILEVYLFIKYEKFYFQAANPARHTWI